MIGFFVLFRTKEIRQNNHLMVIAKKRNGMAATKKRS